MTLAEFAARGALAMFWFQATSVASDGARGESDAGGAGKTEHEPRSPDGATPGAAPAGPAARSGTEAASATTSAAKARVSSQKWALSEPFCEVIGWGCCVSGSRAGGVAGEVGAGG